jgi:hypothetical protein
VNNSFCLSLVFSVHLFFLAAKLQQDFHPYAGKTLSFQGNFPKTEFFLFRSPFIPFPISLFYSPTPIFSPLFAPVSEKRRIFAPATPGKQASFLSTR